MKKEKRFDMKPAEQSGNGLVTVITDKETGVQYLLGVLPNMGSGMTVLVDANGAPLLNKDVQ